MKQSLKEYVYDQIDKSYEERPNRRPVNRRQ